MPIPENLTMNLIQKTPEGWEGCDKLDCLPGCWPSEHHCERLCLFMIERGIPDQPFTEEVLREQREAANY